MPRPKTCDVVSIKPRGKPAGKKRSIEERLETILSKLEAKCAERKAVVVLPFKRAETLEDIPAHRESRG